jgi:hypothetical protein
MADDRTITVPDLPVTVEVPDRARGPMRTFRQSPDDKLRYTWDWSRFLASGETITDGAFEVAGDDDELTKTDIDDTSCWLEDGTVGETYIVSLTVTTSAGRIKKWSMRLTIVED